jgi:hypothetical protein
MTAATKALFVRIRNAEGKYLARGAGEIEFCADIKRASIFDCRRDHIEQQLEYLRLTQGLVLNAEPVDPKEIHETCDRCGKLALSFQMFFDGKRYLCESCRHSTPGDGPLS